MGTSGKHGRQTVRLQDQDGPADLHSLVISGIAGRWVALARRLSQCQFIFLELDTPMEKCIERVTARRRARGNTTPFNPVNLIRKFKSVTSSRRFLANAGLDVRLIDHERAYECLKNLLGLK